MVGKIAEIYHKQGDLPRAVKLYEDALGISVPIKPSTNMLDALGIPPPEDWAAHVLTACTGNSMSLSLLSELKEVEVMEKTKSASALLAQCRLFTQSIQTSECSSSDELINGENGKNIVNKASETPSECNIEKADPLRLQSLLENGSAFENMFASLDMSTIFS